MGNNVSRVVGDLMNMGRETSTNMILMVSGVLRVVGDLTNMGLDSNTKVRPPFAPLQRSCLLPGASRPAAARGPIHGLPAVAVSTKRATVLAKPAWQDAFWSL